MTVTLRANNLQRGFGTGELRTLAVRDVSLELCQGEITILMGPSGSGKSTLLALLSGLLKPDSGTVHALDREVWKMSERQREAFRREHCGFIFQGYNLFPALTANQQLEIVLNWGAGIRGRQARKLAAATLDSLGLKGKGHLRPEQLSGGEKQRVAIARALVKRPALLFADEPTAALDWDHGRQVVEMLQAAAHESGTTVLLVSHDPRLVDYADRLVHLEDGQLKECVQEMAMLAEARESS